MSDEDLSVVGEVLERVITKTVSQEGNKEEGEENEVEMVGADGGEHHDQEEEQGGSKTDTNSPVTPLSLDYGDDDERADGFLESHENNIANGNYDDKAASYDEDVLMDEVNGHYENGGDPAVGVDVCNDDDDINGPPEYVVEKIVEKRMGPDGSVKYQVKWKNYPPSSNTWEPVENLADCDKVMQQFEIRSAEKLAERHTSEEDEQIQTSHPTTTTKRKQKSPPKEYEVNDVMGLTMVGDEKYFLVSLSNSTQKTFIRASLANRIVPQKVIDFYIKSMRWKSTS